MVDGKGLKIKVISNTDIDKWISDWLVKIMASKMLNDPSFQEILFENGKG